MLNCCILSSGTNQGQNLGQSVFDYIEKQHSRSPLFYNFLYVPETDNPVSEQARSFSANNLIKCIIDVFHI